MNEIFYLNGKLLTREQAKISLLDYGFLYGYGLYETLRAYNGKAFRLDNHLARLKFSGERLGIPVHVALIRAAVNDVIKANGFTQTRLRISISPGEGSISPNLASCELPTIAVLAMEYTPPTPEKYVHGYHAVTSVIRRNNRSPVVYHKTANTMESMLARQESRRAGVDEAVFMNEKGYITEAAGSNIFIVSNGKLLTPKFEAGILPGVTRVIVFELATQLGIKFTEVNLKPKVLTAANEAFLTNSMVEIMPLTQIDDKPIAEGKPGPITNSLMKAYHRLVKKEAK